MMRGFVPKPKQKGKSGHPASVQEEASQGWTPVEVQLEGEFGQGNMSEAALARETFNDLVSNLTL